MLGSPMATCTSNTRRRETNDWAALTACSALHVLLEVVRSYRARQVEPYFVRLNPFCTRAFEMAGIMAELGTDHVFDSVHDALAHGGHLRPNVAPAVTLL